MDIGHENFATENTRIDPFVTLTYDGDIAGFGFAKKHFGVADVVLVELINIFVAHRCNVEVALRVLGQSHRIFDVG